MTEACGEMGCRQKTNLAQTFMKKSPVDVSAPPAWLYGKQWAQRGLWVVEFWAPGNFQTTVKQSHKKSL